MSELAHLFGDYVAQSDWPPWMAVWLMIIADNACHLAVNRWALRRWR